MPDTSAQTPFLERTSGAWLVAGALAAAVAAVYWQVGSFGFVNFDDPRYLTQNEPVKAGLTWAGARWAFTTFHLANWHPVTWLSHMLDVELFGLRPGPHHAVNAALHAANAALLFLLLRAATGRALPSALAAALFALHPLHVESVAWVSERKDVLSTLLWLLTFLAYGRYARQPSRSRMLWVLLCCALGLMAKPMLVTLPFTLLLADLWPLGRLSFAAPDWPRARSLLVEKVPLFALSALSAAVAYTAQSRGGAIPAGQALPFGARAANAVVSAAGYLAQAAWPADLAAIYPHPGLSPDGLSPWRVAAAALALCLLTGAAWWQRRARPWLAVGWAFYLGTLVPVLGLVQVGFQGHADRYTYVPLIGVFVALSFLAADLLGTRAPRAALAVLCALWLAALSWTSAGQAAVWRDSLTLFQHAVAVTRDNGPALRNLGVAWQELRRPDLAAEALERSVALSPLDAHAWMDLGVSWISLGRVAEAQGAFEKASRMRPGDPVVWYNLALCFAVQGRLEEARRAHARLTALDPGLGDQLARKLARVPR